MYDFPLINICQFFCIRTSGSKKIKKKEGCLGKTKSRQVLGVNEDCSGSQGRKWKRGRGSVGEWQKKLKERLGFWKQNQDQTLIEQGVSFLNTLDPYYVRAAQKCKNNCVCNVWLDMEYQPCTQKLFTDSKEVETDNCIEELETELNVIEQ